MSNVKPRHAATATPSATTTPPPNDRVVRLTNLAQATRTAYPAISCKVVDTATGLPPLLHASFRDRSEEVGCDMDRGGWRFVWGFDPRNAIGLAEDVDRAVQALARILGAEADA
ncbi:hypothetical protein [Actinomadura rayongensis]|uniref:Uncharacterized protein n=1 Tax=Actinomadura rayongensis TaxID=1429076 RepID=A0A6I4W7L3_9ACTN|nr:hypothetical protein [Actinomadura rayongensis]MXQ65598.1 hypothetical protein [Actinomadura rayongensis]